MNIETEFFFSFFVFFWISRSERKQKNYEGFFSLSFFLWLRFIKEEMPHCRDFDFSCDDGSCHPLKFRCDGRQQCGDASDEINCPIVGNAFFKCF